MKTWRTVRVSVVRESANGSVEAMPRTLRSGSCASRLFRDFIRDDPREVFCAIYLDAKHRPIAIHRVSVGTADHTAVSPREVFGPALSLSAVALLVAHNHPSGDPTPSADDRAVTDRLRSAGELLGIELIDHIVVGAERYYSFSEQGFYPYSV